MTRAKDFSLPGCRRWRIGCLLIICLIIGTLCFLLIWLLNAGSAAAADSPLAVWLLIDNSNSMFEKDGIGSDPDRLRLDAARLFLSYLGVDEPEQQHQAAVIFFGSEAETAVPLTPLADDAQRRQMFTQIAQPERLGWTDHLAALNLAYDQIEAQAGLWQPALILLTDGEPEWGQTPTRAEKEAYLAQLESKGADLAHAGIPLFIILLENDAVAASEDSHTLWRPLWQRLAEATPQGQFFVARSAAELPDVYHQIVVALTGRETEGVVVQTAVTESTVEPFFVAPNLAQLTLVISKEAPEQTVSIVSSSGQTLAADEIQVRRAGGDSEAREEIWVIENPLPGQWFIHLDGQGQVTIWQDVVVKPESAATSMPITTATATTAPIASNTAVPTATPTMMASQTAVPTWTPSPTATAIKAIVLQPRPRLPTEADMPPAPRWPWFLLGLMGVMGGTAVGLWWRQQNRPLVTGSLRLLDGQLLSSGNPVIDLDNLQRPVITIGRPPAEVALPQATALVKIHPILAMDGSCDYFITPLSGRVTLDELPLTHETRLTDTAVIGLDGLRLRYENLWLRQTDRERQMQLEMKPHSYGAS